MYQTKLTARNWQVFHPNIDEDGTIYVDILEEDQWKPIQTIETLLVSICSLLAHPEPVDTFKWSCYLYQNDWEEYNNTAREWTRKYAMGDFDEGTEIPSDMK